MPASAHTVTRRARGFTLVEILVVVVIIGVLIAGAILSLSATGKDSALEQERDRLAALMTYVRERGQMLTLEYGIRCTQHGYAFSVYDTRHRQWIAENVDDALRKRTLPAGLKIRLIVEGREILLKDTAPAPASRTGAADATTGTVSGGGRTPGSGTPASAPTSTLGGSSDLGRQIIDYTPQVMLYSNGDTNSFALIVEREGLHRSATLQSAPDGTIQVGDVVEQK